MLTAEQLALLFTEMRAWREEGLLDEATHQRLRERYEPPISPGEALELELEAQAAALVEQEARAPELDEELAAGAAAHLADEASIAASEELERAERAAALELPVQEREAALVSSVAAAARDVAALAPPETKPSPAAELAVRESLWTQHVRPFLVANSLWLAGGLLILFGSLYFLRLIWDDLSNLLHHAVIAGSLHLYAAAFFGAGYVLSRRRQAHVVGRILFCFTVAILPLGSVALGELVVLLLQAGGLFVPLGIGALLLGLSLQAGLLAVIGGLFERACQRPLLEGSLSLALLTASVATLELLLPPQLEAVLLLGVPLGFLLLGRGLFGLCRHRVLLRQSLLLGGSGLLWSFLVLVVRAGVASPLDPTHYASLIGGVAALLVTCDRRLRAAAGEPPRLSALGLLLHGVVLLGVGLSVVGLARLGYFHLGARLGVLASSAVALWVLAGSARLHGRSAFTHLAATTGLLTYFFLPAPFAGLLLLAQRWVSRALGYAHEPLPVAYYGLTFIPYLLLVAGLAIFLRRRRRDLSLDLQRFLMAAGALLSVLALASRGDLRPMLWTWPIYAAGAYLGAALFARPGLRLAGHALTLAGLWVLGLFLAPRGGWLLSSSVLLSCAGVLAALAALLPRREDAPPTFSDAHFAHAAIAASALSIVAVLLDPLVVDQWLVTAVAVTLALALLTVRLRSRVTANLAAAGLLLDVLLAHPHFGSLEDGAWALLAVGVAATALVFRGRRSDEAGPRHQLIGQPATVLAASALALSLLAGIIFLPRGFPLLPAAALCVLALQARGAVTVVLGAAGLAVALGSASDELARRSWPMVLSALAALLALAAPSLPRPSPRTATRRALSLSVSAGLIAMVALVAAAKLAGDAGSDAHAYRWGFLGALGLSLYLAALTRAHRDARDAWLALAALALSSSVAALLLLRATVDPMSHGLWAYGALAALLSTGWVALEGRLSLPRLRRTAAVVSPLLLLLPLVQEASHLLLALMRCQPSGDWLLGMVSLPPGRWAVLCAAAALAAGLLLRRVRPGWASRHILLAAALGLAVAAQAWISPAAHLTVVLSLAAVALAAVHAARPVEVALGWPIAVAGLAFLASHLHLEGPGPSIAGAASTAAVMLLWRAASGSSARALATASALALLGTGQLITVWLAATFSTGRYPAASVASLLAVAALAVAPLIDALSRRRLEDRALSHLGAAAVLLAGVEAASAVLGCRPVVPGFVLLLSLSVLVVGGLLLLAIARRHGAEWTIYAALLGFTVAYLLARRETALAAAGPWLDGAALLLASQIALGLGRRAGDLFRRPLLASAALWPGLGLLLFPELGRASASLLALLIALHYGASARALQNRHLTVPGVIFGTVALLLSFAAMEWSDPLLLALPVVGALLVLTHVYRDELGRAGSSSLRCALLLGFYTLGVSQALTAVTPLEGVVVVPALCVVGLVAGTLLRVRSYVLVSVAFLAADLMLNMLRYGLASRPLGALFLTLLGITIVSGMVVFTLERERILRRYSTILGELRTWD